jgi:hypothetical protein
MSDRQHDTQAANEQPYMTTEALACILVDVLVAQTDGTRFGAEWFVKATRFEAFEFDPGVENGFVLLRDGDGEDGDGRWPLLSLPKPRIVAEAYVAALPLALRKYRKLWEACEDALLELG